MSKFIYVDVCALSRPFDDQSYMRIRLETAAVNLILSKTKEGRYKLVISRAHDLEISAIEDAVERIKLQGIPSEVGERLKGNPAKTRSRTERLVQLGCGVADAAHVAFAESCGADLITCDDRLVRKCLAEKVDIWCGNPVAFCEKEGLR